MDINKINFADFNFYTKQNIKVKYDKNKNNYKVILKSNKNLIYYQVWNKNGYLNNDRKAFITYPKEFVKSFINYNLNNKIKFTPTTIIDFGESSHILIMTNVKINKKSQVVLYFEKNSIEIISNDNNDCEKINSKLPQGKFNDVRFDIDSLIFNTISVNQRIDRPIYEI